VRRLQCRSICAPVLEQVFTDGYNLSARLNVLGISRFAIYQRLLQCCDEAPVMQHTGQVESIDLSPEGVRNHIFVRYTV
jgi:hypothetical protein